MIDKSRISELINLRQMHGECGGDAPEEWWTEVPDMLSENLEETKKFLSSCKEEDLDALTELFENISSKINNKEFINFIEELQIKHPKIDMKQDIEWAKQAIED